MRRCARRAWTKACRWPTPHAIPVSGAAISKRSRPRTPPPCRRPSIRAASCAPTPSTSGSTPQAMVDLYQPSARREPSADAARRRAARGDPAPDSAAARAVRHQQRRLRGAARVRLELVPGRPAHPARRRHHPAHGALGHADAHRRAAANAVPDRRCPSADARRSSRRPSRRSPSPTPVIDGILVEFRTNAAGLCRGRRRRQAGAGRDAARRAPSARCRWRKDSVVMRASNGLGGRRDCQRHPTRTRRPPPTRSS